MKTGLILASVATVAFVFAASPASGEGPGLDWTALPWDKLQCDRDEDEQHPEQLEDAVHTFPEPANPLLTVAVHIVCLDESLPVEEPGVATDCTSRAYKLASYKWTGAFPGFRVDSSGSGVSGASTINGAGNTWDNEVAADIHGSSSSGGNGAAAGTYDGVHQVGWKNLASGTIAVTTTWYFTQSGQAVESDAAYNTDYGWSLSGEANKMDLGHISTHEIGHTFGLNHPKGSGISCLTMYAYANFGQTHGRTLGDGDILGIEAKYGA